MDQDNAHVKTLITARERMIQDRRNLSEALACEYKSGHTERMRESFIISQNSIEAIDRAIDRPTRKRDLVPTAQMDSVKVFPHCQGQQRTN